MGLGFNFGGKDAGLTKAIDGALMSVSKLTSGVAGVSSALGQLAEQGRDPTTGFEKEMIANNVSLTRMGANLGKTGKDIGDFTQKAQSLALTMNRGADVAGEAQGQFERMGAAAKDAGIGSSAALLKLADSSGVAAKQFADSVLGMTKMEGVTAKAAGSILDSMTAAGKATGDVNGALAEQPKRMELLFKRSAMLRAGYKGIGIEEFSKQIDQTAVDMQHLTKVSAAQARQFSTGLAESLQDAALAFQNLQVGGEQDTRVLEALSLTTGSVQTAFRDMQDGPEGFMKTMSEMTKNMGGDKDKIAQLMKWVQGKTGQAFGPERSAEIVNFLSAQATATEKHGKAVKEATGALKKYGDEAFKNGRTAAESMQLSEDMFVARLRNINKTADTFARDAGKSFKMLGDEMEHLGKDKGPAGQLTQALVDLDQKGLVGLLPTKLQGTAVALGGLTKRLGKTLEGILNPLSAVESLLVLFGTAMTHAFMLTNKGLPFLERLGQAFESVGEDAVNWLENLPDKIINVFYKVTDAVKGFFSKDSAGGASKWGPMFKKWWDRIVKAFTRLDPIIAEVKQFSLDLWNGITTALDPSYGLQSGGDEGSVGTKIGQWIRSQWDKVSGWVKKEVWPKIAQFGSDFWGGLVAAFSPDGPKAANPDSTGTKIGTWVGDAIKTAFEALKGMMGPLVDKLGVWISDLFVSMAKKAATGMAWMAADLATAGLASKVFREPENVPTPKTSGSAPATSAPRAAPEVASSQSAVAVSALVSTTKEAEDAQKQRDEALLAATNKTNEKMDQLISTVGGRNTGYTGEGGPVAGGAGNVFIRKDSRGVGRKP